MLAFVIKIGQVLVKGEWNDENLEMVVNCEGGLYIKELISGDEDRTQPSVTSLLGITAKCVELDVLEVNI